MKISDSVYLVGGGKWSMGISHPVDCSIYLIDTGDGCIMIDSGCSLNPELIERNINSHGFSMSDVKILVITHYHGDHACGAKWIHEKSGCRVYTSAPERECIASGDDIASSLAGARGSAYPADFVYPACPCIEGINEGDLIKLGNVELRAIFVPGHSLCDLVLYGMVDGKKSLFCGDALFSGGEILIQSLYDVSILPYREGINKLVPLNIDALFPGHGQFILGNASWHVEKCAEGFNSGLIPKQFHFFS